MIINPGLNTLNVTMTPGPPIMRQIGWLASWSYVWGTYHDANLSYLTHLGYTSIRPISSTDPTLEIHGVPDAALDIVVSMAHAAGIRAGGSLFDTTPAGAIQNFINTPALLSQLASNIAVFCTNHNLDFLLIDWEPSDQPSNSEWYSLVSAIYNSIHPLGIELFIYNAGYILPASIKNMIDAIQLVYNNTGWDEETQYGDMVRNFNLLVDAGWPGTKIIPLIWVYARSRIPGNEFTFGDVYKAGLDVTQSIINFNGSIPSRFNNNQPWPTGGQLMLNGINLAKRIVAYAKKYGGGFWVFESDYDTDPNDSPFSLIRNAYEELMRES
jgi:hypothetical protein